MTITKAKDAGILPTLIRVNWNSMMVSESGTSFTVELDNIKILHAVKMLDCYHVTIEGGTYSIPDDTDVLLEILKKEFLYSRAIKIRNDFIKDLKKVI